MNEIDLRPTFGDYIRKARKGAGLSQAQVAAALGTSQTRVSRWENDEDEPTVGEYVRFSRLTGVTADLGVLLISWNTKRAGQRPLARAS